MFQKKHILRISFQSNQFFDDVNGGRCGNFENQIITRNRQQILQDNRDNTDTDESRDYSCLRNIRKPRRQDGVKFFGIWNKLQRRKKHRYSEALQKDADERKDAARDEASFLIGQEISVEFFENSEVFHDGSVI